MSHYNIDIVMCKPPTTEAGDLHTSSLYIFLPGLHSMAYHMFVICSGWHCTFESTCYELLVLQVVIKYIPFPIAIRELPRTALFVNMLTMFSQRHYQRKVSHTECILMQMVCKVSSGCTHTSLVAYLLDIYGWGDVSRGKYM